MLQLGSATKLFVGISAIATLIKATDEAPRPYKFIILSDHGQSLGETFLQRYGVSLGEYVRSLMSGRATLIQTKTKAEGSVFVNSFLSEITRSKGVGPAVARVAFASKTGADGVVDLDADKEPTAVADASSRLGSIWASDASPARRLSSCRGRRSRPRE